MIELYENLIQIAVLVVCFSIAVYYAAKDHSRPWTILAFFYGSLMLGDIFWLVCLIFYGKTPEIAVVSDLSWLASYLFLYLLLRFIAPPEEIEGTSPVSWLGPVFTVSMAVFFMQWGNYISNIAYAGFMGLLLFSTIRRLAQKEHTGPQKKLSLVIFIFCILEYAIWTSSCFVTYDTLAAPYYWFDFLMTVSLLFFIPAMKKAVAA